MLTSDPMDPKDLLPSQTSRQPVLVLGEGKGLGICGAVWTAGFPSWVPDKWLHTGVKYSRKSEHPPSRTSCC